MKLIKFYLFRLVFTGNIPEGISMPVSCIPFKVLLAHGAGLINAPLLKMGKKIRIWLTLLNWSGARKLPAEVIIIYSCSNCCNISAIFINNINMHLWQENLYTTPEIFL